MNSVIQNKFKPQRFIKLLTHEDIHRIMSHKPSTLLAFSDKPDFPEGSYVISRVVATQMSMRDKFQALLQNKWYPYVTTVEEVSLPEANKQRKGKHTDPLERAIKEDMAFEKAAKDYRKNREDDLLNELYQTLQRVNEICEKIKND